VEGREAGVHAEDVVDRDREGLEEGERVREHGRDQRGLHQEFDRAIPPTSGRCFHSLLIIYRWRLADSPD
jgi:hypothetical protein